MTPEELALLDRFAGIALHGMSTDEYYAGHHNEAAIEAYSLAYEMILERRERRKSEAEDPS